MRVWLDDVREPGQHGWEGATWAKTAQEAIRWLATGEVEAISLDHDLGEGPVGTGYDVVCWMEEQGVWPPAVYLHTANPVGRARMLAVLRKQERERCTPKEGERGWGMSHNGSAVGFGPTGGGSIPPVLAKEEEEGCDEGI
jgi:hypothetical protein